MKKNYKSPKVQKLVFDYTDAVTASGEVDPGPSNTGMHREKVWTGNQTFPSSTGCSTQARYVSYC